MSYLKSKNPSNFRGKAQQPETEAKELPGDEVAIDRWETLTLTS